MGGPKAATSLRIGAHVEATEGEEALAVARALGVDCVQVFLGDPQKPVKPPERPDLKVVPQAGLGLYVHAPYMLNICSPKNNVRWQSRTTIEQTCAVAAAIGATAVVVHGGYAEDSVEEGIGRWRRTLEMLRDKLGVPLLIENTAGGTNAVARRFDVLARLWDAIGDLGVGFCFDTCHAHAAGEELDTAVDRVLQIVGRIDLVHANDSRDPPGSGRDRHANLGRGQIGEDVLRDLLRATGAPVVICETPGGAEEVAADLAFVRAALAPAR